MHPNALTVRYAQTPECAPGTPFQCADCGYAPRPRGTLARLVWPVDAEAVALPEPRLLCEACVPPPAVLAAALLRIETCIDAVGVAGTPRGLIQQAQLLAAVLEHGGQVARYGEG